MPAQVCVCGHWLSFLLGKYTRTEWLGHIVGVNLTLKKLPDLYKVAVPFCPPSGRARGCGVLHLLPSTGSAQLFKVGLIQTGTRGHLSVVFTGVLLTTQDVEPLALC